MFPDLVLTSQDRGKRLEGIIEVETGESVNHLEAMAQWAHFGRVRTPFHLYVPASAVEIARRLCVENQVNVAELWSFHTIGDQTRFTLVQRSAGAASRERSVRSRGRPAPAGRPGRETGGRQRTSARRSRTLRACSKAGKAARKRQPAPRAAKARPARPKAAARKPARAQKRK